MGTLFDIDAAGCPRQTTINEKECNYNVFYFIKSHVDIFPDVHTLTKVHILPRMHT